MKAECAVYRVRFHQVNNGLRIEILARVVKNIFAFSGFHDAKVAFYLHSSDADSQVFDSKKSINQRVIPSKVSHLFNNEDNEIFCVNCGECEEDCECDEFIPEKNDDEEEKPEEDQLTEEEAAEKFETILIYPDASFLIGKTISCVIFDKNDQKICGAKFVVKPENINKVLRKPLKK